MKIGLLGLGKTGFNMRAHLRKAGIEVVGYDPRPAVADVPTLKALAQELESPRVAWAMVPSGTITRDTVGELREVLSEGDLRNQFGRHATHEVGPSSRSGTTAAGSTS